jgi:putative hydrolase of the HAD superfamily
MTRPSAVLFDIGDTLLHEVRFDLEAGLRAALPDHLRDAAPRFARSFREELFRAHAAQRELMLARWVCANVPELREVDEDRLERAIWADVVTLLPTPGARALLDRLQADDVKMGAISNAYFSGAVLRQELERHGLADVLEVVLSSADLGIRKPDRRIFREALGRLGVAADRAWYVGDTFDEDIEGALLAGLMPIWLCAGPASRDVALPVRHLHDWMDVASLYETAPIAD